ncbi:hypothetical protein PR048_013269 [Dryococelus australis]|uniref:Uncharacterized protein n=1 Tax=Dryococelus australis TaxID=614101 RepID=A0ABQ9HRP9_9NEOP|nr:hypothetical protein PR048_013269 [Dryococelus australis]
MQISYVIQETIFKIPVLEEAVIQKKSCDENIGTIEGKAEVLAECRRITQLQNKLHDMNIKEVSEEKLNNDFTKSKTWERSRPQCC